MGGGIKIGAAYVRVSSEHQEEYSPASQLKLIRDYAKRDGYIIPDEFVYQDDGISGKSADKRPAFRLMIATAKEAAKPFDAIFVWKFSRFARNQEEAIMYKNLLRKKGVEVVSISEPSNDSPFASLIERIIEWMDEYYLINLAGEVRRGLKEKASRGEATGKPPFGYRVENKTLVQTEDAEIVRLIFEQYAAGKSIYKIAADLNAAGIKKLGNKFGKESIRYILKNSVYTGKIRWSEDKPRYGYSAYMANLDELPDGKHTPIISRELWDAVQERMKNNRGEIKYQREGKTVSMFKGLIRCSACGGTLAEANVGTRRNPGLQCCGYNRGACHVSHYIKQADAQAAIIAGLEAAQASGAFKFAEIRPAAQRAAVDWGKLIAQEETRLKRARTAYLDGALSLDEYKEVKAAAEESLSKLRTASADGGEAVAVDVAAYKQRVADVLEIIKAADVDGEAKNAALRSIVDKIVYNKAAGTMDFYFLP